MLIPVMVASFLISLSLIIQNYLILLLGIIIFIVNIIFTYYKSKENNNGDVK